MLASSRSFRTANRLVPPDPSARLTASAARARSALEMASSNSISFGSKGPRSIRYPSARNRLRCAVGIRVSDAILGTLISGYASGLSRHWLKCGRSEMPITVAMGESPPSPRRRGWANHLQSWITGETGAGVVPRHTATVAQNSRRESFPRPREVGGLLGDT